MKLVRICNRCHTEKPEFEYYPRCRICKVCILVAQKLYREAHKSEIAEFNKAYYEAHKAELLEVKKCYGQTPNGKAVRRQMHTRRRARKHDAFVEDVDFSDICSRDRWICCFCHKRVNPKLKYPDPMSTQPHHCHPIALGGKEERKNVFCSHKVCNGRAGKKAAGCQLRVFG